MLTVSLLTHRKRGARRDLSSPCSAKGVPGFTAPGAQVEWRRLGCGGRPGKLSARVSFSNRSRQPLPSQPMKERQATRPKHLPDRSKHYVETRPRSTTSNYLGAQPQNTTSNTTKQKHYVQKHCVATSKHNVTKRPRNTTAKH